MAVRSNGVGGMTLDIEAGDVERLQRVTERGTPAIGRLSDAGDPERVQQRGLPGIGEQPSWAQLAVAFAEERELQAELDDLKAQTRMVKKRHDEAVIVLRRLGRRLHAGQGEEP